MVLLMIKYAISYGKWGSLLTSLEWTTSLETESIFGILPVMKL